MAPELKADDIGGLVQGQHERELLPVQIQRIRQQLIAVALFVEMGQLQRS